MIQQLPVYTSSALQEAHSVYNSVQDWMLCIDNLKPQAFINGDMDEVTTYMSNKHAKQSRKINLMRFLLQFEVE